MTTKDDRIRLTMRPRFPYGGFCRNAMPRRVGVLFRSTSSLQHLYGRTGRDAMPRRVGILFHSTSRLYVPENDLPVKTVQHKGRIFVHTAREDLFAQFVKHVALQHALERTCQKFTGNVSLNVQTSVRQPPMGPRCCKRCGNCHESTHGWWGY